MSELEERYKQMRDERDAMIVEIQNKNAIIEEYIQEIELLRRELELKIDDESGRDE